MLTNNTRRLLFLLIISSFGPYILPKFGLRLEHLIVYPAGVILFLAISIAKKSWHKNVLIMMSIWLAIILLMVVVGFANMHEMAYSHFLADFESMIQGVVLMFILMFLFSRSSSHLVLEAIDVVTKTLITLLVVNTFISISQTLFGSEWVFSYFIRSYEGMSVAAKSATGGRYSGIFDQPIEAGATYTLGLLSWGYLIKKNRKINTKEFLKLLFLFVGGVLTVSKVFILGGIPLFILYLAPWKRISVFLKKSSFIFYGALILVLIVAGDLWRGFGFLSRYFVIPDSISEALWLYTAKRFGREGSAVSNKFLEVWTDSPVYGFGLGSIRVTDNGFLDIFYKGGSLALFLYIILIMFIFTQGIQALLQKREDGKFLVAIFILIVGINLGAPALVLNRFSTIIWILICLLFFSISKSSIPKNCVVSIISPEVSRIRTN
jgi:hypothetical protein